MINILYEDNHILVVEKPINMPVQQDNSKDNDLLNLLKAYIKNKYNKPGNVYLGLVHRLDRPVGGVMIFAKTSKAASRICEQIRNKEMKKTYYAVVMGIPKNKEILIDKIEKNKKTNTVKISGKGKEAKMEYKLIQTIENLSLVKIKLETGRPHQIRIGFSSRNMPLYGDQKYGEKNKKQIALFAKKLSFIHPTTKKKMTFELPLPNRYPFTLFKENNEN